MNGRPRFLGAQSLGGHVFRPAFEQRNETGCGSQLTNKEEGKKERLIKLCIASEAVVYDFSIYYFYYTVAIASRVFSTALAFEMFLD